MPSLEKDISYYSSDRRDFISIFPEGMKKVLDVGCGAGNFGQYLKKVTPAEVVGIEINEEAARIARQNLDRVICADVEKGLFDFEEGYFDIIIFADVLEHLIDPWAVLKKMRKYLRAGGYILVSVPNIRYYRILLNIIFKGEFKYTDFGILDAAHLRFFTFKMLRIYLQDAGFRIVKVKRNFSGNISWIVNKIFFNLFADFFTRQYIVLAHKTENYRHEKNGGRDETGYSNTVL